MSDCVGCGYCCLSAPCWLASVEQQRCVHLWWNGQQYRCRLAGNLFHRKALSMGEGCCSSLNTWRKDVKERG